jgi:hypothetical protein
MSSQQTAKNSNQQSRAQYSAETKAMVHACYPLCRTPADRDRLARDYDIESTQKLYNLASRINATRPHAGSSDDWTAEDGYDATRDYTRLYIRDNPDKLRWSKDDDRFIREHFGRTKIEAMGVFLRRSETAISYRARTLGLRNVPKYYDVRKVAPWLGLSISDLMLLTKFGLEVFPCTDVTGQVRITLVSTVSLARTLVRGRLWKRLVDRYDADRFFIKDIMESIVSLQKGSAVWEPNAWVSHGHVSLNPFSETCFGLFYDGYDSKMSGDKFTPRDLAPNKVKSINPNTFDLDQSLDPRDLSPDANVVSDDWRRGENGQDDSEDQLKTIDKELLVTAATTD